MLKLLLQGLLLAGIILGLLCVLDVLSRPRWWRSRGQRYRIPYDVHDVQRRIARNGLRQWLGFRQ